MPLKELIEIIWYDFKLIYASDGCSETKFEKDTTLVNSQYSKFSIQPTIISKDVLTDILNKVESLNIWDFENAIKGTDRDYMVRFGNETKRGFYHYDSSVYPYISTAINKGQWNYTEYPVELHNLFEEYHINPFNRGII